MKILGRLPTVPEYYKEFIANVDLTENPKQCCPFHKEDTPSFSYDIRTGRWSCFGQCKAHGDVIDMHRRWAHLKTREQAELSLRALYQVKLTLNPQYLEQQEASIDKERAELNGIYQSLILLAGTSIPRYNELDEIMSQTPVDKQAMVDLLETWQEEG